MNGQREFGLGEPSRYTGKNNKRFLYLPLIKPPDRYDLWFSV